MYVLIDPAKRLTRKQQIAERKAARLKKEENNRALALATTKVREEKEKYDRLVQELLNHVPPLAYYDGNGELVLLVNRTSKQTLPPSGDPPRRPVRSKQEKELDKLRKLAEREKVLTNLAK